MDSLQIISNLQLDTLSDTISIITDSISQQLVNKGQVENNIWIEVFVFLKSIVFILIGAFISKIFSDIRNHRRLFKLYEFLNVVFVSLLNRVTKHKSDYSKLIEKLNDPTNTQFIPPLSPGSETEIINSLNKEDLFEIYLIRLNTKSLENSKRDFLYLLNSIKYFDLVFTFIQNESKKTVDSITHCIDKIVELHFRLLNIVTLLEFQSNSNDKFIVEISHVWKEYLKLNGSLKITNFNLYEEELILKINDISIKYSNENKDPRAYNLTMLLWSIMQELSNFKEKKNSLKEFLKLNEKFLNEESLKFKITIEKFGNLKYRNWLSLSFGKKLKHDTSVFNGIKETNA